jgi:hypothetical protein
MSDLAEIFSTQNLNDDDASVIDSYLIETDAPPDLKDAVEPIPDPYMPPAPLITRLLTGTQVIDSSYVSPFRVLPQDDNRKSLQLFVTGTNTAVTFNDFLLIGGDQGTVSAGPSTAQGVTRVRPQAAFVPTVVLMMNHTGAVWVVPGAAIANAIELSWIAVTE